MGSKRDGVPVPSAKHGDRPARAVRASVRARKHSSVADEAPRCKRRSRTKRFAVEYRGDGAQGWKRWFGRYETPGAARQSGQWLAEGGSGLVRGPIETRVVKLDILNRLLLVVPDVDGDS